MRLIALSAVILATVPIIFLHSTIGYANLPMGVYLVLGALWGVDGIFRESKRHQMLSGLMLGFTVWTILEGGLFVISAVLAIIGATLIVRKGRIYFIHWLFPIAIIGGIWVIFYKLYGGSGSSAMSATQLLLNSILRGEWDFPVLRLIFGYARRNIFDPQTWGFIYPVGFTHTAGMEIFAAEKRPLCILHFSCHDKYRLSCSWLDLLAFFCNSGTL